MVQILTLMLSLEFVKSMKLYLYKFRTATFLSKTFQNDMWNTNNWRTNGISSAFYNS